MYSNTGRQETSKCRCAHINLNSGSLETLKFGCEDIYFNIGRQETFKFRSFRLSFSIQREVSKNHPIMDEVWMQVKYHLFSMKVYMRSKNFQFLD